MTTALTLRKVDALLRWLNIAHNFIKNVDDHLIVSIIAVEELRANKLQAKGKGKNQIEVDYQNFIEYCAPYVQPEMLEALKHGQITDFRKSRTKGRAVCYYEIEQSQCGIFGFNKKVMEKFLSDYTGLKVMVKAKQVHRISGGFDEIGQGITDES